MNLAKIRQKARSQRVGTLPSAAQSDSLVASSNIDGSGSCFLSEAKLPPLDAAGTVEAVTVAAVAQVKDILAIQDPVVRKREIDPLKAILAGREAAGCDDAMLSVTAEPLRIETVKNYAEFLMVRIADELYGIDIMRIKEIIKPITVTEVPRSPVFLPGVISLRGVIIPVIDMLSRLGFSAEADPANQRIVVIRAGAGFAGLLVDDVIQVQRIDCESIEHAPTVLEGVDREFISGIGRCDNRMIIILSLDNVADINLH